MRVSKFFRFTIAGDSLNVDECKEMIPLEANAYYKDMPVKKSLGKKKN